ncbi:hypothetical protein dsx2_1091 [Desulfovibrio sp. X2]|uniref:ArnT family glycosyltransferase n=1 Tax=Desulfovibrio sp. X2 TaxID=941449 RepID=UPI000358EFBD|nr:hypothetical protein [Desulfovibrio sp. X2]EPR37148.1 hypothetical protein dsx2_1091 [Desulfovibrio sp. X2]
MNRLSFEHGRQRLVSFLHAGQPYLHRFDRICSDTVIVLLLTALAACVAVWSVGSGKVSPQFYQSEFAPAVAMGCGDRATAPGPALNGAVTDFLFLKRQTLSCEEVPAALLTRPQDMFQKASRYLIGSVGLMWKLTGINWGAVRYVDAVLYALSAAFVYGLFRLAAGRLIAVLGVVLLIFSKFQLYNLPHLRDYSKAPFIFAALLAFGLMARYPLARKRLWPLSGAVGAVLGLGIGFRMDMLLFVPMFPVVLLAFLPGGFRRNIPAKAGALASFACAFLLLGWPILRAMGGGGNMFHVIVLGLTKPFDAALGIVPSIYTFGYKYNDSYVWELINSFAHRVLGAKHVFPLATAGYDQAGLHYYLAIAKNFPADLFTRFLSALLLVLSFALGKYPLLAHLMPKLALAILAGLAFVRTRLAVFAYLMIFFLCGYPSLQFQERHFFHLQIISLWILAIGLNAILLIGSRSISNAFTGKPVLSRMIPPDATKRAFAAGVFLLAAVLVPGATLSILRSWQQPHARTFLEKYEQLPVMLPGLQRTVDQDGTVYLRAPAPLEAPRKPDQGAVFPLDTKYWLLKFDSRQCAHEDVRITTHYDANSQFADMSMTIPISLDHGVTSFYTSTLSYTGKTTWGQVFAGFSLSPDDAACLEGVYEVEDLEKVGLLPDITFHEDWKNEKLYQRSKVISENFWP